MIRNENSSVLLTDLYQLTMLQGYFEHGMEETAVFELFIRKRTKRNFYVAAGLEQAMEFLENLRFTPDELEWLAGLPQFRKDFIDRLADLRFTGDVHAMAEGTLFFPDEPILRVTAPMPQAQLVESRLINLLHFQTVIASKAARMRLAAPDRLLVDFGMRRAHGAEAGLLAARASYLGGFDATSTVLAGKLFGIPLSGTMAHSFVEAHEEEETAFAHFAESLPGGTVLLIDTYDTERAAAKAVALAPRLREKGIEIQGVRLDSGDLAAHARAVRAILDRGGLAGVKIFSSGSLDEHRLKAFADGGVPIDGFGVGTRMDTSSDAPYLDCAYKLEEYADLARRKLSEGKATWPGRKQVYRYEDERGIAEYDVLTVEDDLRDGRPLIRPVMREGRRLHPPDPLTVIRERFERELASLPQPLKSLDETPAYEVRISDQLRKLAREVDERLEAGVS
ncbi:MAG: nicotinate phosphoribosyltransferase [Desulfobacteraceae bacterium]|nr:nicotinate phosphoribosyltransferase [Desulfobacteraceae bacterium]